VLRIQKVTPQDVGNYSCHAENAIGESVKTFWLQTRDIQVCILHCKKLIQIKKKVSERK